MFGRSGRRPATVFRTRRSSSGASKDAPTCDTTSGPESAPSPAGKSPPAPRRGGSGPEKPPAARTVRDHPGCGPTRAEARQAPVESPLARQAGRDSVPVLAHIPGSARPSEPTLTPPSLGRLSSAVRLLGGASGHSVYLPLLILRSPPPCFPRAPRFLPPNRAILAGFC